MANSFGKAFKVPYKVNGLDASGVTTTDPLVGLNLVAGDNTVARVVPDDSTFMTGWIFGVADGEVDVVANATSTAGAISGAVHISISDAVIPPVVNPAASIGITLGDAVPQ